MTNEPKTRYRPGYLSGAWVVQYDQGGRTWFLKDRDGKTIWFDHRSEAVAYIEEKGLGNDNAEDV